MKIGKCTTTLDAVKTWSYSELLQELRAIQGELWETKKDEAHW